MSDPDPMNLWRLAGQLSVEHAAFLIANVNPAEVYQDPSNYPGYSAAFHALRNEILANRLAAELAFRPEIPNPWGDDIPNSGLTVVVLSEHAEKLRGMPSPDPDTPIRLQKEPDWGRTTVDVATASRSKA